MTAALCMAAPNGARRDKTDHPRVPLSPTELAATAAAVSRAGAAAIHLHVRDTANRHTLCPDAYRTALAAIRQSCGDRIVVQITTEAAGMFTVRQQLDVVYDLKPEAVSLSVQEIGRADPHEIAALDRWMRQERVLPQWIIYKVKDLAQYHAWLNDGTLCGTAYPLLFVLGSHTGSPEAEVDAVQPAWSELKTASSWMVCGFGPREPDVVGAALALGGHARVGFENNIWHRDGTLVADNTELVTDTVGAIEAHGLRVADAEEARRLLTPHW